VGTNEWSKLWYNPQLKIQTYQAVCIKHGFPLHMHDYYVVCFVEWGLQSFSHRRVKHLTPPGGLILLNPGDDHTGEPADENGFEYRALYPTLTHMREVMFELTEKDREPPCFSNIRVDNPELTRAIRTLHLSLNNLTSSLECESLLLTVLAKLITEQTFKYSNVQAPKKERYAVQKACRYICEHATEGITLRELANEVGLSRYYLLRVFREEMGMPPYAYLESIRIGKAKKLLETGLPLTQVASELGFSDQSHFTNCFKRFIGVTPGQYASEVT
jgi:AraC-like DNA-binding protein